MKTETVDEAAKKHATIEIDLGPLKPIFDFNKEYYDSFKAGANWQKQQDEAKYNALKDCLIELYNTTGRGNQKLISKARSKVFSLIANK